jgi:hypothetical protein
MPEGEPVSVSVTPAQLSFLAIYNPSLGTTDETLIDQIVFYYSSKASRLPQKSTSLSDAPSGDDKNDTNERLRQIGLAQGMVNFAKWVVLVYSGRMVDMVMLTDDPETSREGNQLKV